MHLMEQLQQAEFYKLEFELCFTESIAVDLPMLLRLRRAIRAAAQYALHSSQGGHEASNRFGRLLAPPLATDPVARRQFQKGSPTFALQHDIDGIKSYQSGDHFTLTVNVWGGDVGKVQDLILVMQSLGTMGLATGSGRFKVVALFGEDSSGYSSVLWQAGQDVTTVMPPVRDAAWWLNNNDMDSVAVQIRFNAPARLLVKQRPLFNADFDSLFPFILRRVTSMLYTHCHVDLAIDQRGLLNVAQQVVVENNTLAWQDWRELSGGDTRQPIGGVSGTLALGGDLLPKLLPYIYLGSMMNLGKNAAYGAGSYRVV